MYDPAMVQSTDPSPRSDGQGVPADRAKSTMLAASYDAMQLTKRRYNGWRMQWRALWTLQLSFAIYLLSPASSVSPGPGRPRCWRGALLAGPGHSFAECLCLLTVHRCTGTHSPHPPPWPDNTLCGSLLTVGSGIEVVVSNR